MDTDPTEMIALVDAPREAKRQGIDDPPTYRTFYVAVLDGKLEAERRNGRWEARRGNLLAFAARRSKVAA
jgi:hypothetical protein